MDGDTQNSFNRASPFRAWHWSAPNGHQGRMPDSAQEPHHRPEELAQLEVLDDVIFAAIDGNAEALDAASRAWEEALRELGPDLVEESRQQYLRRAKNVWESLRREPNHEPHRVFAAIEIISLLVRHE